MMQRPNWHRLAVATVAAPLLVACGTRDTAARNDSAGGTVAMTDSTSVSSTTGDATGAMDSGVASFVAAVNQSEIEAGRLASTKARNGDVKDYARDMVDDHQKALNDLRDLGRKNNWTMPDSTGMTAGAGAGGTGGTNNTAGTSTGSMTGSAGTSSGSNSMLASTITQLQQSHQAAMTKLRGTTGAAFDRAYIDSQVAAHQQALDVLRQHATSLQNTELRDKITDMQKDVEDHLKRAQEIAQKLGGSKP